MSFNETFPTVSLFSMDDELDPEFDDPYEYESAPLLCIIAVLIFSILGNSSVIAAFFRDSRLRVIFNLFVVHLATADLMISFLVIIAVIDEMTKTSFLAKWPIICQVCTVFTNALLVEQLILSHIMCNDRHRALQRGMSYTRCTLHWHVEKLILFLTWVISFVGSFLVTDLMSSVKMYGYGSCKFYGRLLYISCTSFLHFFLLVSLTVAMLYIIFDFRRHRKTSPQFVRLGGDWEEKLYSISCRADNATMKDKKGFQNLVPRSPVSLSGNFAGLSSQYSGQSTRMLQPLPSFKLQEQLDYQMAQSKQMEELQNQRLSEAHQSCSSNEVLTKCLNVQNFHGKVHERYPETSEMELKENSRKLADSEEDIFPRNQNKYQTYGIDNDNFKPNKLITSTLGIGMKTWLPGDGPMYEASTELIQTPYSLKSTQVNRFIVEDQYQESKCNYNIETATAKSQLTERKMSLCKGKHQKHFYVNDLPVQTIHEAKEEDEAFIESAEDLLPTCFSVSDDGLAEIPQPNLKPHTDSLYTLRSCLSMSEESLFRGTDEVVDDECQSEGSCQTSRRSVKSHVVEGNKGKTLDVYDNNESSGQVNTDHVFVVNPGLTNCASLVISLQPQLSELQESPIYSCSYDMDVQKYLAIHEINVRQTKSSDSVDTSKHHSGDIDKEFSIGKVSKELYSSINSLESCSQKYCCLVNTQHLISKTELSSSDPAGCSDSQLVNQFITSCNTNLFAANRDDWEGRQQEQPHQTSNHVEVDEEGKHNDGCECCQNHGKNFQNDNNSAGTCKIDHDRNFGISGKRRRVGGTSTRITTRNGDKSSPTLTESTEAKAVFENRNGFENRSRVSFKSDVAECGATIGTAKCEPGRYSNEKKSISIIEDLFYANNERSKVYDGARSNVDNTSGELNDCKEVEQSKSEMDLAVENWVQFYDINLTSSYTNKECESHSSNKIDNLKPCQKDESVLQSHVHSMPSSKALARAKQNWFDFYGINLMEKSTRSSRNESNKKVISVPVSVHVAEDNSLKETKRKEHENKPNGTHLNRRQLSTSIDIPGADLKNHEYSRMTKRLTHAARCIHAGQLKTHLEENTSKCLNHQIHPLDSILKEFVENLNTDTNSPWVPIGESFHENIEHITTGNSQEYSINKAEVLHSVRKANTFSNSKPEYLNTKSETINITNVYANLKNGDNKTDKHIFTESMAAVKPNQFTATPSIFERNLKHSALSSEKSSSGDIQKVYSFETEVPIEQRDCCSISSENDIHTQMKRTERVNTIFSIKECEESGENDVADFKDTDNLIHFGTQRDTIKICGKNEKYKGITEVSVQGTGTENVNFPENLDQSKDNSVLNKTKFIPQKNNNFAFDKSIQDFVNVKYKQGLQEVINSDQKARVRDSSTTTYQIFEYMSMTCRALLAELGIYQDILSGDIPIDMNKMHFHELEDSYRCPDCERRKREKLQKVSGQQLENSKYIENETKEMYSEFAQGNKTANAKLCRIKTSPTAAETNMPTATPDLSLDSEDIDSRSTEGRQGSIEMSGAFEDADNEAGTNTTSAAFQNKSKDYMFTRMPWKISRLNMSSLRKFNFEELKARDPELSILLSLVCIVILQVTCWLPITILYMIYDVTAYTPQPSQIELAFLLLWCSRLATQPLLYACYSKYFRENFIQFMCCQSCR